MFCQKCGTKLDNTAAFCSICGTAIHNQAEVASTVVTETSVTAPEQINPVQVNSQQQPIFNQPQNDYIQPQQSYAQPQPIYNQPQYNFNGYAYNPVTARLNTAFSDVLFLLICIFTSVYTLFSSFSITGIEFASPSAGFNPDVFGILFTIFFWMTYASAKKGNINVKTLRSISGTVLAAYIVIWVLVGIFTMYVLSALIISGASTSNEYINDFVYEFGDYDAGYENPDLISLTIIGTIFLIIIAAIALINIFFIGGIHKFIKSVYTSAYNGFENIQKANSSAVWLLVIGIIGALTAFDEGVYYFLTNATLATVFILLFAWIKKHFPTPVQSFTPPPQSYMG